MALVLAFDDLPNLPVDISSGFELAIGLLNPASEEEAQFENPPRGLHVLSLDGTAYGRNMDVHHISDGLHLHCSEKLGAFLHELSLVADHGNGNIVEGPLPLLHCLNQPLSRLDLLSNEACDLGVSSRFLQKPPAGFADVHGGNTAVLHPDLNLPVNFFNDDVGPNINRHR